MVMTADKWRERYDAGAKAYDDGLAWSSQMDEPWRSGWIQRQSAKSIERASAQRSADREFKAMMRRAEKHPPLEGDC